MPRSEMRQEMFGDPAGGEAVALVANEDVVRVVWQGRLLNQTRGSDARDCRHSLPAMAGKNSGDSACCRRQPTDYIIARID